MTITKSVALTYTLLSANVVEDGSLQCMFEVTAEDVSTFTKSLSIPFADIGPILDTTITDSKTIRETMTSRIYNYFVDNNIIAGTVTT